MAEGFATGSDHSDDAVGEAVASLGALARRDVPIGTRTTYRVGGSAAVFVEAESVDDLLAVARASERSGLDVLAIGRGSNLLVSDRGFRGIAVAMGEGLAGIRVGDDLVVTAGAATALPVLARRTVHDGLSGLEWAVGVPGSVGGAVRMNAGGHGADVAASLVDVDVVDIETASMTTIAATDLGLRFRGSNLTGRQIVCSARFALERGNREDGEALLREIVRWRRENQPGGQNAGSVFVNPFDGAESAGRLIDEIGLKGFRVGSAHVSSKHANFVQVDEGGSADDVRELMATIVQRVLEVHGIELRSEIRLIGFDDRPGPSGGES